MSVLSGVVSLDPAAPEPVGLDVRSSDRRWRIGWSGRIDNAADFARRFDLSPTCPHAQLMADALSVRGISAAGHAIGDFALAAWDSAERCLWLARDAIGFRPLFYCHRDGRVSFSTEMRVLRRGSARDAAPNEGFLAEVLADFIVSVHETPLAGVFRVLPAEALGFRRGASSLERVTLWRPPTSMPPRRTDADLIAECRDRLETAVAASLGGEPRVSAQLSGGLDSTAIVALVRQQTGAAPDTYSAVYPSHPRAVDGEMLDESAFIDVAVAATGARSVRFEPLGRGAFSARDLQRVLREDAELPNLSVTDALNYPLFARAAADGHAVMLTGVGGDYWLSGSLGRVPWHLRRWQFRAAWQFLRAARLEDTLNASWPAVRAHVLTRLAPAWVRALHRRRTPARSWPSWIPDAFAERVHLGHRLRRLSDRVAPVDDDVLHDSLLRLSLAEGVLVRETLHRAAGDAGISVRHPMLDRRFVEFAMTLPDDLRMRGTETRYILRRACVDVLPAEIFRRRSKGGSTVMTGVAIARVLGGAPLAFERAAARGWLDPPRLMPQLAPFLTGDPLRRVPAATDDRVWNALAVELWLISGGA